MSFGRDDGRSADDVPSPVHEYNGAMLQRLYLVSRKTTVVGEGEGRGEILIFWGKWWGGLGSVRSLTVCSLE